jgi:hypothetical protein
VQTSGDGDGTARTNKALFSPNWCAQTVQQMVSSPPPPPGSNLPGFPFPWPGSVLVERTAADIKPQIDENLENVHAWLIPPAPAGAGIKKGGGARGRE